MSPPDRNNRKAPRKLTPAKAARVVAASQVRKPSGTEVYPALRQAPGGQRSASPGKEARQVFKLTVNHKDPRWPS